MSRNARPRHPRPSAFIAASLAAKRPATCSAKARGCRRARADLARPEDAREEALAVALEHAGDAIDLRQVEAEQQPVGGHQRALQAEEAGDPCRRSDSGSVGRLPASRRRRAGRPCGGGARAMIASSFSTSDGLASRIGRERRLVDLDERRLGHRAHRRQPRLAGQQADLAEGGARSRGPRRLRLARRRRRGPRRRRVPRAMRNIDEVASPSRTIVSPSANRAQPGPAGERGGARRPRAGRRARSRSIAREDQRRPGSGAAGVPSGTGAGG